jgi:hypothetical protein
MTNKKSFNIVLHSRNINHGGNTGEITYYFDNNQLPEGNYKLTFSFSGMLTSLLTGLYLSIYATLGQDSVYEAGTSSSINSNFIGTVAQTYGNTIATTHNVPVFLERRLQNNRISIALIAPDGTTYNALTYYALTLHFEPL